MSGGNVLDTTKIVLKSLVLSSPEPLTIPRLERDYENQEGKPIPFGSLGHPNLRSFLLSMPDILVYDQKSQTFSAGEGGRSEHIHRLVSGQKPKKNRSNSSKTAKHYNSNYRNNNAQHIWDSHPLNFNQMSYSHQNLNTNVYETHQTRRFEPGKLLDPPNYYNNSLLGQHPAMSTLISNLARAHVTNTTSGVPPLMSLNVQPLGVKNFNRPKNVTGTKKSNSSPVAVEPSGSTYHNGNHSDSSTKEALPPMDDDDPIRYIGTKLTSSEYGRKIPQAKVPKTLESGRIHQICVTEVTRFPHFHFQFAGKEGTMLGLQDELNLRYEHSEKIHPSEIQIGNACGVWYANNWLRGELLSQPDDSNRVKLLFVDYGTIDYVSVERIRHLYKEMCKYPRLCHRGALAFLEPSRNDRIEKKIVEKFCRMVSDKSLIAVFSNVDESDDISMTLVDTSDPKVDLIVNKILMNNLQEMEQEIR